MFLMISSLFFGYFMILSLPNCIRIIIEPSKTPFSKGFYNILTIFLLLFKECS